MGDVLVEVDVDFSDWARETTHIEHVVILSEIVVVFKRLLILQILVYYTSTLSLVVRKGLGHLVRDLWVHDAKLAIFRGIVCDI